MTLTVTDEPDQPRRVTQRTGLPRWGVYKRRSAASSGRSRRSGPGARLMARPTWRLAHLVALPRDECHRLDQLSTGGLAVEASLVCSYRELDRSSGQLLR